MSDTDRTTSVEYRPVPDFHGYRTGDDGSLWTLFERIYPKGMRGVRYVLGTAWHRMKPSKSKGMKYYSVTLHRDGKGHTRTVHRLVLEAFIGPCPPGLMGLHKDDDRENNRLSNLYWGTPLQNSADARRNGVKPMGEAYRNATTTEAEVLEIRRLYADGTMDQLQLAAKFGMPQAKVSAVVRGRVWPHVGGPITNKGRGGPRRRKSP